MAENDTDMNTPAQERTDFTGCASTYTVRRGDSLYMIARRQGVTLDALMEANPGVAPGRLMVGDRLCIPAGGVCDNGASGDGGGSTGGGNSGGNTGGSTGGSGSGSGDSGGGQVSACEGNSVTISDTQTIADIQVENSLTYSTLEQANPRLDLASLKAGDTVCVPAANVPCKSRVTLYRMTAADTLESLAIARNVSVATLLRANPCLAPGDFVADTCVVLPSASS